MGALYHKSIGIRGLSVLSTCISDPYQVPLCFGPPMLSQDTHHVTRILSPGVDLNLNSNLSRGRARSVVKVPEPLRLKLHHSYRIIPAARCKRSGGNLRCVQFVPATISVLDRAGQAGKYPPQTVRCSL